MAPDLGIPASNKTVRVSIIDTGTRVSNIETSLFIHPVIDGHSHLTGCPAWSFLIEHEDPEGKKQRYLFDLSVRKDLDGLAPRNLGFLNGLGWKVDITKDVADVLQEHGVEPSSVDGIIWSHWHWDHTGDPSRFPASTELVVGPGFKEGMMPVFPTNPDSGITEDAFVGRHLREISFDQGLNLGGFNAYDFFGDGSFYLLDSPGHTIGHLCALARTSSNTFIFMGGDACHHPGVFRPSADNPLPEGIVPNPLETLYSQRMNTPCPGSLFTEIHPEHKKDEPFYTLPLTPDGQGVNHCREDGLKSREKLMRFDASDNVLVLIAHDETVLDIVDVFPKPANEWKSRGWKELAKWRFLKDFASSVKQSQ